MKLTPILTDEQWDELILGSNTVALDNGVTVTFTTDSDSDTSINDFDCYGKIHWIERRSDWAASPRRPDNFDGMAEILTTNYGDRYWFQPYCDGKEYRRLWHTDAEYRNANRQQVMDLLNYGFQTYTVELFRTCESCQRPESLTYRTMGGIEPFAEFGDQKSVLDDLIREAFYEIEVEA